MKKKYKYVANSHLKKRPASLILLTDKAIVHVRAATRNSYLGYNIFNDSEFIEIHKDKAIPLPQSVLQLMKNEDSRICLANVLYTSREEMAIALGISERTVYRIMADSDYLSEKRKSMPVIKKKIK